jgi:eukaryotic-like serine/threonine-protein kinase
MRKPLIEGPISIPITGQLAWGHLKPGTCLGGAYRLIRRVAQGGMGDIYLASHERLSGRFAVKVLSPILDGDQEALLRFRQEATVMSAIRHPNVIHVLDFDSTSLGMPYMVMEYLDGQDLSQTMSMGGLEPPKISRIVRKVASGLHAAHSLGIVHRDLKPENIMIVPREGQRDLIKVIDFGICKARSFGHFTAASTVLGTPEFMSPEQARGNQDDVNAQSDQFALAVISYLMLTGRTPWGTTEPVATLRRVVNDDPLPLGTYTSPGWQAVEAVLFRGMAKAPGDRYSSTLTFSCALDVAMIADGLLTEKPATEAVAS